MRVYTLPGDAYIVADGVIAQGPAQFREALQKDAESYLDGKVRRCAPKVWLTVIATAIEGDAAHGDHRHGR